MNFYDKKKAFLKDMKELVLSKQNINTRISIANLELRYGQGFGFGKSTVIKGLELFAKFGYVRIEGDHVIILGKKEIKPTITNNAASTGPVA